MRIYPEKQDAGDFVPRHTVRVKAFATELRAGLPIHFKSFDVDDPSSDSRPVDSNGVLGDDNFGVSPGLNTVGYTDAYGAAELTMSVSTQPGDNFKVAASCNASYIAGLQTSGIDVVDVDGLVLPTPQGDVTDLLTVWRKLHVEVDSLGLVTGNQITGSANDHVPFVLNTPDSIAGKIATYDFDAAGTAADPGFWTVYLLGAYQHDTARDLDGEKGGFAGAVDEINGLGASIFLEALADDTRQRGLILGCSTGATVAHEIGHLFGATHSQGGLMDTPRDKSVPELSGKTIATIRQIAHP